MSQDISQADRDKFATLNYLRGRVDIKPCDHDALLAAFARHAATARAEALEEAANKARDLYLFPPPTSRAARFHQRVTQDAISDAIRALVSDAGKSS